MESLPRRISLVAQTEKVLIDGIGSLRWKFRLPGERSLSRELKVSRWTVRAALKALSRCGAIRSSPDRRSEIAARPGLLRSRRRSVRVGFVLPEPVWRLTSFAGIFIHELRALIQKTGGQADFYSSRRLYGRNCAPGLEQLVAQNPHDCWIPFLGTRAMQQWFAARGVPTIVSGSCHKGVLLPSHDIHYTALGRHAAGAFLARGHRRLALLGARIDPTGPGPGVVEMERGAREVCSASRNSTVELSVIYYDPGAAHACRVFDQLLGLPSPPTALLFAHSATLLTALTYFGRRQIAIPRDFSVIVAQDESYYPDIVPELTHYEWNPEAYANSMFRLVQQAVEGTLAEDRSVRTMPRFIPGKTLDSPPPRP